MRAIPLMLLPLVASLLFVEEPVVGDDVIWLYQVHKQNDTEITVVHIATKYRIEAGGVVRDSSIPNAEYSEHLEGQMDFDQLPAASLLRRFLDSVGNHGTVRVLVSPRDKQIGGKPAREVIVEAIGRVHSVPEDYPCHHASNNFQMTTDRAGLVALIRHPDVVQVVEQPKGLGHMPGANGGCYYTEY